MQKQKRKLSYYEQLIVKAVKCKVEDVREIEEIMRNNVGRQYSGCLDHLDIRDFNKLARKAHLIHEAQKQYGIQKH